MPTVTKVATPSGRKLAVHRIAKGTTDRTVVLCHPAPGTGNLDPVPELTSARDLTLISVDRAGYGDSDPRPDGEWATPALAAQDLAAVLDELGIASAGVAGWCAGGHVALALAAQRPDLVQRLVLFATPAPESEVASLDGDLRQVLDSLGQPAAKQARDAVAAALKQFTKDGSASDDAFAALNLSPFDDVALEVPGARQRLAGMLAAAFTHGVEPWAAEVAATYLRPWGFSPDDVAAKTLLLFGARDPVAGRKHATYWVNRLADARIELAPKSGHLLIFQFWKRALSHLAPGTKS